MNRRKFLIGAAGAGVALVVPMVAMAVPVDTVPALATEYYRVFNLGWGLDGTDEEADRHCDLVHAAYDRVCAAPALTMRDLRAKLEMMKFEMADGSIEPDDPLIISIMTDVARFESAS